MCAHVCPGVLCVSLACWECAGGMRDTEGGTPLLSLGLGWQTSFLQEAQPGHLGRLGFTWNHLSFFFFSSYSSPRPRGWRDDSVVKTTGSSSRGLGLDSEHSMEVHNFISRPRGFMPLLAVLGTAGTWCTCGHAGETLEHQIMSLYVL